MEILRKSIRILPVILMTSIFPGISGQHVPDDGWKAELEGNLAGLFSVQDPEPAGHSVHLSRAGNDIEILASAGFFVYKSFISSQDKPSCIFTPSCSEYAMQCIEMDGLFLGWLRAFDRLSRCHGLVNPAHYHFDSEKQRFHDPVD